jgi:hypothetical protein
MTGWATCLKEVETGRWLLIPPEEKPDNDDPRFEQIVHIVPVKQDGEYLSFGIHDFTPECYCHPKVQEQVFGRTIICHTEVVN